MIYYQIVSHHLHLSRFTKILHGLETKELPLTIVPPGKVDEMSREEPETCFCQPPDSEAAQLYSRDRAETLVEPPAPKFTNITEVLFGWIFKLRKFIFNSIACSFIIMV